MSKFIIPIQSMTDVITNSSSELFVISENTKNFETLKELIETMCDAEDNVSGDGGSCEIETISESFWGAELSGKKDFYDWPLEITEYTWWETREGFPKCCMSFEYGGDGGYYSIPQLQVWFLVPMSKIFDMYLESLQSDLVNSGTLKLTPDMILVEIDWAKEETIKYLKSELGAIKITT